MSTTIERVSPVPYYEQLFTILSRRIAKGEIAPDERLPSENELCREFGLSRATVRQTLSKLESEGFARRVARRGVFASSPQEPAGWAIQDPQGFLELQLRHGRVGVETDVVGAQRQIPPQHVADALGIDPLDEVLTLERVRSLRGRLAMFSTNWFSGSVARVIASAADVLDGSGSVNSTLRNAGFVTLGARRIVEARGAPERVAQYLEIDPGHPILRVRSLSWDQNDVRFDYYETWVLTDIFPLEVSVAAN